MENLDQTNSRNNYQKRRNPDANETIDYKLKQIKKGLIRGENSSLMPTRKLTVSPSERNFDFNEYLHQNVTSFFIINTITIYSIKFNI